MKVRTVGSIYFQKCPRPSRFSLRWKTPPAITASIFSRRADGTFGFEEYRRDPEDVSGWFSLHRYSHQVFSTAERRPCAGEIKVEWMIA